MEPFSLNFDLSLVNPLQNIVNCLSTLSRIAHAAQHKRFRVRYQLLEQ